MVVTANFPNSFSRGFALQTVTYDVLLLLEQTIPGMEKYGTETGVPFNGLTQMVRLNFRCHPQIVLTVL